MIEKSKRIDYIFEANPKMAKGFENIINSFSKLYPSYSDESCRLLSVILSDYFNKFNITIKVEVKKDIFENIKIILNIDE